ncbi:MAG: FMN-binding protein [Kiritimatiellae bacterium]|nr:FMN-binding protein [Kiritimatiellia bacterium]
MDETRYLTEEEAAAIFFPGETMVDVSFELTPDQMREISAAAKSPVFHPRVRAQRASGGGWMFLDEAMGKHEGFDIALGINEDGTVKGIEILLYREEHGFEVRDDAWRAQFVGKTTESPLKMYRDIQKMSGATYSSKGVADSARRLLHTWRVALKST